MVTTLHRSEPVFRQMPNLVFKRQCYNRAVAGVYPMDTFEAYVLIVSSTIALFWLSVRSEVNRSLSPHDDRSVAQ